LTQRRQVGSLHGLAVVRAWLRDDLAEQAIRLLIWPRCEIEGIGVRIEKRTEHDWPQSVDRDRLALRILQRPQKCVTLGAAERVDPAGCVALEAEIANEDGAAELAEILRRSRDAPWGIELTARSEALDQNAVGGEDVNEAESDRLPPRDCHRADYQTDSRAGVRRFGFPVGTARETLFLRRDGLLAGQRPCQ
jgi:hypothetical protein